MKIISHISDSIRIANDVTFYFQKHQELNPPLSGYFSLQLAPVQPLSDTNSLFYRLPSAYLACELGVK